MSKQEIIDELGRAKHRGFAVWHMDSHGRYVSADGDESIMVFPSQARKIAEKHRRNREALSVEGEAAMTAIKERPIPFSSPMVNAIREKRKWMTRRLVKLRDFGPSGTPGYDWRFRRKDGCWEEYATADLVAKHCPYGRVGDRLYVKEGLVGVFDTKLDGETMPIAAYAADRSHAWEAPPDGMRVKWVWKRPSLPSIHMPRRLARVFLEITDVRVERLNDISPQDAWAEGVRCSCMSPVPQCAGNIEAFRELWESLHGKGSWAANDWLWAITFREVGK